MHDNTQTSWALKIGLLTHSVNPHGGVIHTLELAEALHTARHAHCPQGTVRLQNLVWHLET